MVQSWLSHDSGLWFIAFQLKASHYQRTSKKPLTKSQKRMTSRPKAATSRISHSSRRLTNRWAINNGLVYGQLYIGNVRAYKFEMKRCHRCLRVAGHLAWSYKETLRCRHCGGEHDRRDCPPGTEAKCVDCNGPYPTGDKECREPAAMNS
ncbi:hypothetical protein PV05_05509 [Exophiala xenobiotica]|uniref:CCHC-type domain-containing protein n=1 Tax=Exophiala xenobiotica TaxID=348802 RepID=A0A0D2BWS3_9EURO|nr:uncharacterized protein PV05_05509 [Exophiala xenobiotica]KIW56891.1 hypothetical protein PV05_05509 [Exophiala xenobiotica]